MLRSFAGQVWWPSLRRRMQRNPQHRKVDVEYIFSVAGEGHVETVEKCLQPLIRLTFPVWTSCGRIFKMSTSLWRKIISPIYSPPKRRIPACLSCIPCIFFVQNPRAAKILWRQAFGRPLGYPQTHSLWISSPVDRGKCRFRALFGFWAQVMHRLSTRRTKIPRSQNTDE